MNNKAIAPVPFSADLNADDRIELYKRNADFLRRILESSGDCIKVLDLDGHLLYMNDGGTAVMEIDNFDQQVKGALWLDFWQDSAHEAAIAAFQSARAGESSQFDGYCPTAKGSPRWWNVALDPIRNNAGEITGILSISRDVTEQKRITEALKARTQELDSFAYMVSHDLKGPLRGISSIASWIEEDLDDLKMPETCEHLQLLQERILRLEALIEGLLKYSRVGREQVATQSVDMNLLLQTVVDSMAPPAGFKVCSATTLPTFKAKEILLSQVIANLVSNAIKHHDKQEGTAELSFKDKGSHFEFALSDDGPGIDERYKEKIFEMFQTLEDRTAADKTGIGLAIVKKIIDGEGGKLWVEDATPRGSRFCFTWPK